jgi:hypothetical protein
MLCDSILHRQNGGSPHDSGIFAVVVESRRGYTPKPRAGVQVPELLVVEEVVACMTLAGFQLEVAVGRASYVSMCSALLGKCSAEFAT